MFVASVTAETDAGVVNAGQLTRCVWCDRTKAEIEARGEAMEEWKP